MHYASSQKILLVGEGDFSFALCLARAFETAYNMVATSLDSLEMLGKKYSNGVDNVRELEERGCIVLHGVDATQMSQHYFLSTQRFDRVIYNFPHVGFMFPEDSTCQIKLNKQLVKGFLMNAKLLLMNPAGEVHVSHKEGQPYSQWDLAKKAAKSGLVFHQKVPFRRTDYPGYSNKRADGYHADNSFPLFLASTFIFHLDSITS
uniref:25S rRNA (uridine-N(3))-methyltransferase BMT5-like domain-containing protein n=2 Tax=Chenopodium quinoa TaxID=63459 RepID=A0A803M7I2_CHEQI